MSALAAEHQAINLSQGFPEFAVSEELIQLLHHYVLKGYNQYAPMQGIQRLRERIAEKIERQYQYRAHPADEITITAGATEALYAAIATLVSPGDEVIVLEPAYDSYVPAILTNGGVPVRIHLNSDFTVNWEAVRNSITCRTRLIIINTPHNPSGMVFSEEDLQQLAAVVRGTKAFILSDEVYEHIVFDGLLHQSVLRHEELAARSVAVFSFGKTFHITGWKVGYFVAPAWLSGEIRKVHQYLQFSVFTPAQYALADYLSEESHYLHLSKFYEQKRDLFLKHMEASPFQAIPCRGTYFQLFSYRKFSDQPDRSFAEFLTREAGVASIPVSVFYQDGTDRRILRFCFAKHDETLVRAARLLSQLS